VEEQRRTWNLRLDALEQHLATMSRGTPTHIDSKEEER
jgi:hypothetical protein